MKIKKEINEELKKVFLIDSLNDNLVDVFLRLQKFIDEWEYRYTTLKSYRNQRNSYYFNNTQYS